MRIERLTLRGFLRFREPVSLDLTELPPGLIALVGPNGEGKTTLLEAAPAALYRQFMSRGDLIDYATERDSFLELQLAVDGRGAFRARVNVDGVKRTSDAVLEAVQPDGRRTPLNDGKISTFDQAVAAHFPTKGLLLASAFAAQNKAGSFLTLDKKARKTLFLALLDLERYQVMSDTAKQAAALVEQARTRLVAVRELLARESADALLTALDQQAADLDTRQQALERRQGELRVRLEAIAARLAVVRDQAAAYAAATQRLETISRELATRQAEARRLTEAVARGEQETSAERSRIDASCATAAAQLDELLANNRKLLANAAAVREAVAAVEAATTELTTLRAAAKAHRAAVDAGETRERELQQELNRLQTVQHELARAEDGGETLQQVPCAGAGDYAGCRFLTTATAAATKIPALRVEVGKAEGVKVQFSENRAALVAARRDLSTAESAIETLEASLAGPRRQAALAEKLAVAEARIQELEARRRDALATAAQQRADLEQRHQARQAELASQQTAIAAALDRLLREHGQAQQDQLAATEGHQAALAIQGEQTALQAERDDTSRQLGTVAAGRTELARRRTELLDKRAQAEVLRQQIDRLSSELVEWQTLAKAYSRDGLPNLEIDAAGPTVSAYTNELLQACFGARFSVDLVTQVAKADGKGLKEAFTIAVTDNLAGGETRDLADLSGGEQVIVSEALMNALAIYVNTRAPLPVRTLWRDETTGALDPANAQRYLAMLRKVQELSGAHHVLFITHNPDAAAQADAQIRVAGGRVTVALPPYFEAAA